MNWKGQSLGKSDFQTQYSEYMAINLLPTGPCSNKAKMKPNKYRADRKEKQSSFRLHET